MKKDKKLDTIGQADKISNTVKIHRVTNHYSDWQLSHPVSGYSKRDLQKVYFGKKISGGFGKTYE